MNKKGAVKGIVNQKRICKLWGIEAASLMENKKGSREAPEWYGQLVTRSS